MAKMIIAIDVETEGLDARKFKLGVLITERNQKNPEAYYDKDQLWERVIELATKEEKRGKNTYVYCHNLRYDFHAFAKIFDPKFYYHSDRPLIATYEINKKHCLYFLDSMSIYPMSLKKLGEFVQLPKMDMKKDNLLDYCIRDTQIVLQAILKLKKKLKSDGIYVRRLYTISQIAISYVMKELQTQNLPYLTEGKNIISTKFRNIIPQCYKSARVEVFKQGKFKNINYYDVNSLYPYSISNMKFPDLRTEQYTKDPLKRNDLEYLFTKTGFCSVMIKNQTDPVGILLISNKGKNKILQKGETAIVNTTLPEVQLAINHGHKLIAMHWCITYNTVDENPFEPIMNRLYQLRHSQKEPFYSLFYKQILNCSLGKFGQHKKTRNFQWIHLEDCEYYDNHDDYEMVNDYKEYRLYKYETESEQKRFYNPVIPALMTSFARIFMYHYFLEQDHNTLIYTDTDSIITTSSNLNRYLSDKMGDLKLEHQNSTIEVFGKKTYIIDGQIKMSGLHRQSFEKGIVKANRMTTMFNYKDPKKIGSFNFYEKTPQYSKPVQKEVIYYDQKILENPESLKFYDKYIEAFIN